MIRLSTRAEQMSCELLTTCIYGLFDPREPWLMMYVGKGRKERTQAHWKDFVRTDRAVNRKLLGWFRRLKSSGVVPSWKFIEENIPVEKWEQRERFWIAEWREVNPKLCNISDGGVRVPSSKKVELELRREQRHEEMMQPIREMAQRVNAMFAPKPENCCCAYCKPWKVLGARNKIVCTSKNF